MVRVQRLRDFMLTIKDSGLLLDDDLKPSENVEANTKVNPLPFS